MDKAKQREHAIWEALEGVTFPGMSRDIVSFGFVDRVVVDDDGRVKVALVISTHNSEAGRGVKVAVEEVVGGLEGVSSVDVDLNLMIPPTPPPGAARQAPTRDPRLVPDVRNVVAVASGKGGVGKSTVAANLAVSLARLGHSTGLLDADIYGPSVPTMFGIDDKPTVVGQRVQPFEKFDVKIMSLGFVVDADTPVIWRGPMVVKALEQMLADVDWGPLDFLVVDFPPGTGDAPLTMTQKVPMAGAVIVTTPQDVALIDARKGLSMFQRVNVPVLGIVENMSAFVCPHCGGETAVFKEGGGERTAAELGTRFLGRIPLDPAIMAGGDAGEPIAVAEPDGVHAAAFAEVARVVAEAAAAREAEHRPMTIV